ncbi:MAG TPA: hypothetical protein VHR86_05880 [Armatimonadota bacterium]|nr:hypothetical protein [Armatimonadota bacterium]
MAKGDDRKQSKNARVGDGKVNICHICGKPSKPVMMLDGGKKRLVLTCHEKI